MKIAFRVKLRWGDAEKLCSKECWLRGEGAGEFTVLWCWAGPCWFEMFIEGAQAPLKPSHIALANCWICGIEGKLGIGTKPGGETVHGANWPFARQGWSQQQPWKDGRSCLGSIKSKCIHRSCLQQRLHAKQWRNTVRWKNWVLWKKCQLVCLEIHLKRAHNLLRGISRQRDKIQYDLR